MLAQVLEQLHAFVAGNQIRGDHQQFGLRGQRRIGDGAVHQAADHLALLDLLLIGAVANHLGARPDQRQAARDDAIVGFAAGDPLHVIDTFSLGLPGVLVQDLALFPQGDGGRLAGEQRLRRDGQGAAPEFVESRRKLPGDRTASEDIVVGELRLGVDLEVLVADIAPADQRDRIVHDQQLVVHPVVEARGIEGEFESPQRRQMAAVDEGIEDPDLDGTMRFQRRDLFVAGLRFAVVDQDPHTHSAIGGLQHSVGEQPAGLVTAKDEVLQVEGALRGIDHLHAHQKSVGTYRDDSISRIAVVFARLGVELLTQLRLLRVRQRRGLRLRKIRTRRQRRAAAEQGDAQDDDRQEAWAPRHRLSPASSRGLSGLAEEISDCITMGILDCSS